MKPAQGLTLQGLRYEVKNLKDIRAAIKAVAPTATIVGSPGNGWDIRCDLHSEIDKINAAIKPFGIELQTFKQFSQRTFVFDIEGSRHNSRFVLRAEVIPLPPLPAVCSVEKGPCAERTASMIEHHWSVVILDKDTDPMRLAMRVIRNGATDEWVDIPLQFCPQCGANLA